MTLKKSLDLLCVCVYFCSQNSRSFRCLPDVSFNLVSFLCHFLLLVSVFPSPLLHLECSVFAWKGTSATGVRAKTKLFWIATEYRFCTCKLLAFTESNKSIYSFPPPIDRGRAQDNLSRHFVDHLLQIFALLTCQLEERPECIFFLFIFFDALTSSLGGHKILHFTLGLEATRLDSLCAAPAPAH